MMKCFEKCKKRKYFFSAVSNAYSVVICTKKFVLTFAYFNGRKESSFADCKMRSQIHRSQALVHVGPEGVLLHGLAAILAHVKNIHNSANFEGKKAIKLGKQFLWPNCNLEQGYNEFKIKRSFRNVAQSVSETLQALNISNTCVNGMWQLSFNFELLELVVDNVTWCKWVARQCRSSPWSCVKVDWIQPSFEDRTRWGAAWETD